MHCDAAYALGSWTFQVFGIPWVLPKQVVDLLFGKNWFGKQSLKIWNLVPSSLLWTLWKEHNSCNFKDD